MNHMVVVQEVKAFQQLFGEALNETLRESSESLEDTCDGSPRHVLHVDVNFGIVLEARVVVLDNVFMLEVSEE